MADLPTLHPADELATWLGVSLEYVNDQCRQGRWPHIVVGRKKHFSDDDVKQILATHRRQPEPDPGQRWGRSTRGNRRAS